MYIGRAGAAADRHQRHAPGNPPAAGGADVSNVGDAPRHAGGCGCVCMLSMYVMHAYTHPYQQMSAMSEMLRDMRAGAGVCVAGAPYACSQHVVCVNAGHAVNVHTHTHTHTHLSLIHI